MDWMSTPGFDCVGGILAAVTHDFECGNGIKGTSIEASSRWSLLACHVNLPDPWLCCMSGPWRKACACGSTFTVDWSPPNWGNKLCGEVQLVMHTLERSDLVEEPPKKMLARRSSSSESIIRRRRRRRRRL
jgi:hypothetical protein